MRNRVLYDRFVLPDDVNICTSLRCRAERFIHTLTGRRLVVEVFRWQGRAVHSHTDR